jgi:putative intracellular protease/amidase
VELFGGLMEVAILLSPGVTAFEALGPFGVFRRVPGARVHLVAEAPGRVPTQGTRMALLADAAFADHPDPDVVVVPGGIGIRRLVEDEATVTWVARAHESSQWTTAVSTGSVLLAAAGVLEGDATTHWLATDLLEEQGAHAVPERLVRSGKVLTAEGAAAAIEMALDVVARLVDPATATRIRDELDVEDLGPMDPTKPARPETLVALAGPDELDAEPAYVLEGTAPRRRKHAKGRIDLTFATP